MEQPNSVPRRAILPYNSARATQRSMVRQWILKRPVAFKRPASLRRPAKRTPFTRVTGWREARARGN
eukprot:5348580-Amphidinium_carterae.1